MDEVEVNVLQAEPAQARLKRGDRVFVLREELRRDKDLLAWHSALTETETDTLLVAVGLGGVDVPVPLLERPPNGINTLRRVLDLPDAKPEHRNRIPIGKLMRSFVIGGALCHSGAPPLQQCELGGGNGEGSRRDVDD